MRWSRTHDSTFDSVYGQCDVRPDFHQPNDSSTRDHAYPVRHDRPKLDAYDPNWMRTARCTQVAVEPSPRSARPVRPRTILPLGDHEPVVVHLREVVADRPPRLRVVDPLGVAVVQVAGGEFALLLEDVVERALVWRELFDRLLADLVAALRDGRADDVRRDAVAAVLVGSPSRVPEDADGDPGVARGGVRDERQFLLVDGVLGQPPARPRAEDGDEFLEGVLVEGDADAGLQPARQPVVELGEQLLLAVGDEDRRDRGHPVEVVEDAFVLQLVDLVEDDDELRAVVLPEAVQQLVLRRRPAVDVDGPVDGVEQSVEHLEARVVLPAVDVLRVDVEDVLPEPLQGVLRDAGLARAGRPEQQRRLAGAVVHDWLQRVREPVHLGIAMLDLVGDELRLEHASIAYHRSSGSITARVLNGSGWFPIVPIPLRAVTTAGSEATDGPESSCPDGGTFRYRERDATADRTARPRPHQATALPGDGRDRRVRRGRHAVRANQLGRRSGDRRGGQADARAVQPRPGRLRLPGPRRRAEPR